MKLCQCGHLIKFYNENWKHNHPVKVRSKWIDQITYTCMIDKCQCQKPIPRQNKEKV